MVQSPIPSLGRPAPSWAAVRAAAGRYPGNAVGVVAHQVQVATHIQQLSPVQDGQYPGGELSGQRARSACAHRPSIPPRGASADALVWPLPGGGGPVLLPLAALELARGCREARGGGGRRRG